MSGGWNPLSGHQRLSLQAKLSLLLGVAAALPLLLVGSLLVRDTRETLRADALDEAAATAQLGAGLAHRYVVDARRVVEELAGQPGIVAAARTGDTAALDLALQRHLQHFDEQFDALSWRDADGVLRASTIPSPARTAVAPRLDEAVVAERLREPWGTLGPPHLSQVSGRPIVPIAAPIRDSDGAWGTITGTIDLAALADALARFRPRTTLRLSVVDLDGGVYLAHADSGRLLQPVQGLAVALAPLRAGASGALEADAGGDARLVGYAALPDLAWGVLVDEPLDEALGTARSLQQRGQLLVALAVLEAMALGWLLGLRLSRPLRELQQATARLTAGELGVRVPVRGQDELGQVAASFNTMSAEVAAAHAAEAGQRRAAESLAAREALVNRINARVRASLDVDTVLHTTLEELGTALGAARAFLGLERDGHLEPFAYEWVRPGVPPASVYAPRRMAVADLAARERRAIAVADLDTDPRLAALQLGPRDRTPAHTRAVLLAPMFHGDALLGILGIHDVGEPRQWTADEVALVEAVAGEAAIALANARLYDEARTRAQRLAAVARINRAISARLDLATVLAVVADALGQLVPFDSLALLRLDPDGREFRVVSPTTHLPPPTATGGRVPVAGTRMETLLRDRQPLVYADLAAAESLTPREQQLRAAGHRAMVLVPVLVEGDGPGEPSRVLGALGLASRVPGRYGPAELELLEPIAGQLAVALRNADLYAEVAASQRRLEAIVGGIGDGVFVTDPDGRIGLWNAAAERLLGYSAAEVLGRRWQEVVHGRGGDGLSLEDSSRGLIDTLRERGVAHAEAQFLTRQGGELWVSVAIATLTVDDARHWVIVFRDISAYKEVERLKSDFVATVSHELRTPLASIKGYAATLLQRRDRLPPEIRDEYLAIINAEANRLNALVSDLLAVARLERGEVRLERVPTALAPIAHRVAERVARAERDVETLGGTTRYAAPSAAGDGAGHDPADAPRHRVEVAVPANLLALAAPDRLEQVVGNLVENAVKYSPRGGTIRIEGGTRDATTVYLSVADEGVGIPADRQDEVFQPFARVESVLTRETEGAGLGLYICQQLVERMGGTIVLASEPGRGTTVTVSLEAAAASDTLTGLSNHASVPGSQPAGRPPTHP